MFSQRNERTNGPPIAKAFNESGNKNREIMKPNQACKIPGARHQGTRTQRFKRTEKTEKPRDNEPEATTQRSEETNKIKKNEQ